MAASRTEALTPAHPCGRFRFVAPHSTTSPSPRQAPRRALRHRGETGPTSCGAARRR